MFNCTLCYIENDREEYLMLHRVKKSEVQNLPIWEGDRIFFRLLDEERPFFSLKLSYAGDTLVYAALDGVPMEV